MRTNMFSRAFGVVARSLQKHVSAQDRLAKMKTQGVSKPIPLVMILGRCSDDGFVFLLIVVVTNGIL